MGDAEGLVFHGNGAHAEPVVDDLHLHRIHPDDLTKRVEGVGGEGLGFDLQNVRHGSIPCFQLWQIVFATDFYRDMCLTVARQLAITLTVAQYHHLAGTWQGGPCELQRGLAHGPHRHRLLDELHEELRMFGKIVVHGEYNCRS